MSVDAVVGAGAIVVAAFIAAGGSWANHRFLGKHVGKSNGQGSLVQMVEHVLEQQGASAQRMDAHIEADAEAFRTVVAANSVAVTTAVAAKADIEQVKEALGIH